MIISVKHGYETPLPDDLNNYQLGWSIDDKCLYIKNEDGNIYPVINDSFIKNIIDDYINSDEFKTKIESIVNKE